MKTLRRLKLWWYRSREVIILVLCCIIFLSLGLASLEYIINEYPFIALVTVCVALALYSFFAEKRKSKGND